MLICKYYTKNYKHNYFFEFQGKQYRVHSIVYLTHDGRQYLGALNNEAILTEQFINWDKKLCWTYQFKSNDLSVGPLECSTDRPPSELIERVSLEPNESYLERELFGTSLQEESVGIKHQKKDWEIPEVLVGWIIVIFIFVAVAIFKDWYVRLIIRALAGWFFGMYRQTYVNAYTTYTYNEDQEMLQKKHQVLYNINPSKQENKDE